VPKAPVRVKGVRTGATRARACIIRLRRVFALSGPRRLDRGYQLSDRFKAIASSAIAHPPVFQNSLRADGVFVHAGVFLHAANQRQ
jgi:hypothetical protein